MGVPAIQRDWSAGHFDGDPVRWTSSMAGGRELVAVDEPKGGDAIASFRAQADSSFARYQQLRPQLNGGARWRVLTTDGITYEFGASNELDFADWAPLTRMIDPFGSDVRFFWKSVYRGGKRVDVVLSRISYGGNGPAGLSDFAEIVFHHGATPTGDCVPGSATLYNAGNELEARPRMKGVRRLESVDIRVRAPSETDTHLVRTVAFDYDNAAEACDRADHAPIRLLTAIRELGPTGQLSRPAVTFAYGELGRHMSENSRITWPAATAAAVNPVSRNPFGAGRRIRNAQQKWATLGDWC